MKIFLTPNPEPPYNLMVSSPAYFDRERGEEETDDDVLNRTMLRFREVNNISADVESYIVEDTEIPADHECNTLCEFFDAWEWKDSGARVNMAKARGIHMDRIREMRDKELAKKDIEYMKALEANDGSAATVAAKKQELRDIPQTFDLTTDTAEELKNKWPDGLPKE